MDRKAKFQQLKEKLKAKAGMLFVLSVIASMALGGVLTGMLLKKKAHHGEHAEGKALHSDAHATHPTTGFGRLLATYGEALLSVQSKVKALSRSEEENERLRLENTNLRLRMESLQFDCTLKQASGKTREAGIQLSKETGARIGRTLASIHYRPPTHLLPSQLFTLGVSYFKAREDEKAAVIFSTLTGMEENDTYKTPKNFLMTGVAWYRLDNYELADSYFGKVLQSASTADTLPLHAQARLWKALIAKKTNKHLKSQHWLGELLDHHPHSREAAWVNNKEVTRAPAHAQSEDEE